MTGRWLLGIDVGGSGSRMRLAPVSGTGGSDATGSRVEIGADGSTLGAVVAQLLERAHQTWPAQFAQLAAIGVGATGLATLVADPAALQRDLAARSGDVPLALATDAVTAHLGALGGEPGAVIAVGTGAICLATNFDGIWRRVDGWGHLLGDRGAGAWIGMAGLREAARQYDSARPGALCAAAIAQFGVPETWPGQFYTRPDRAAVLASFAPQVSQLANEGNQSATRIMSEAGCLVAESLCAGFWPGLPQVASTSGGVFAAGGAFVAAFTAEFARLAPEAELRESLGTPLDGAVHLARRAAAPSALRTNPPYLWL
ncbi:N-acetylglucosamine kinase [Cryobacterium sp. Y11]|uniref:N-acetylglucosamine kinase n=1 Tax=Cryobacterium sp. Y11 TaxID=2045016 RepID=UPI001E504555|nr:BadF/BadG/BcrA/BcrD ATPase family protein [Cryobacterium sp. Y11]